MGRDGRVRIPYGDLPIPLLEDDGANIPEGGCPSYDVIGRGIYAALRANPDCLHGDRYAALLKDAYPHFLNEMASHILMLDKKDVEIGYLDRKITYLKIFSLIEPDDSRFPLEIGVAYLDRGVRYEALHLATSSLYQAESYLLKALEKSPDDLQVQRHLADVSYLLGNYERTVSCGRTVMPGLKPEEAERLQRRLARIEAGETPRVPAVDYLEAVGFAFGCHEMGEYEEAAAVLEDVLSDLVLREELPMPEAWVMLSRCYQSLAMPRYAEDCLREALSIDPDHAEAGMALDNLQK
jgi:tetratricopeptide (TPR) repeat protein